VFFGGLLEVDRLVEYSTRFLCRGFVHLPSSPAAVMQNAPNQANESDLQDQQLPLKAGMDIYGSPSSTSAMTLARQTPIGSTWSTRPDYLLSEST
jgi:hypothetical protein